MREVWAGLVRRHEKADRGSPVARDVALLRLADFELYGGDRLKVISNIDPAALDGLCQDGFLRTSPRDASVIGPEFAHDELRRYAVARLLLSEETPASKILQAGAPRWSLSAAQLACQASLQRPHTATTPLTDRLGTLQESFDRLVKGGHGARWGDVPGEALLALADPQPVLCDAWPELVADDAVGLRRLARLVDQRLRDDNGVVDHIAVEPIIAAATRRQNAVAVWKVRRRPATGLVTSTCGCQDCRRPFTPHPASRASHQGVRGGGSSPRPGAGSRSRHKPSRNSAAGTKRGA